MMRAIGRTVRTAVQPCKNRECRKPLRMPQMLVRADESINHSILNIPITSIADESDEASLGFDIGIPFGIPTIRVSNGPLGDNKFPDRSI